MEFSVDMLGVITCCRRRKIMKTSFGNVSSVEHLEKQVVTVIIPVWNSGKWLPGCLAALEKQIYIDFTIILVDNGSNDGSVEQVAKQTHANLKVISFPQNLGFAAAVNAGIAETGTPYVALLNVDTIPADDWLEKLVKAMDNAPVTTTSLASKMLMMDEESLVDSAGDIFNWYGAAYKRGHMERAEKFNKSEYVFSACAGAALYRRSLFDEIGLFDERFTSYFEDIDFGFREKLMGYSTLFVPEAKVLHLGHSAGVRGGYYVYLMTRNRLLTIVKNYPFRALMKYFPKILYGQFYFFVIYKKPFSSLKGYLSCLFFLSQALKDRRRIQKNVKVSMKVLGSLVDSVSKEPGLIRMVFSKLK